MSTRERVTDRNVIKVTSHQERSRVFGCMLCEACHHPLEYGGHLVSDWEDVMLGTRSKIRKCMLRDCHCTANFPISSFDDMLEERRRAEVERLARMYQETLRSFNNT